MKNPGYPFELRPLTKEEGGGWLITFSDLPGCMSDGKTPEEAIINGEEALQSWLATAREFGDTIPSPAETQSAKFVQRLPRSLHARLQARAKQEGGSMNTLVMVILAEALGKRDEQQEV